MSGSTVTREVARQIKCLVLSCSINAQYLALWPDSGWNLVMSRSNFSYGKDTNWELDVWTLNPNRLELDRVK